jgi:hypothetical protein
LLTEIEPVVKRHVASTMIRIAASSVDPAT